MEKYPYVSIIIPALNEENYIEKCIRSLKEQDYPEDLYEIILIDNGSQDRTVDIAREFGAHVYMKKEGAISSLRNFGVSKAKGTIYAFVDADCVVTKNWLKEAVSELSAVSVGATGANYRAEENSTWVSKVWAFNKSEMNSRGEASWIQSGNLFIKKEVFQKVKGFDEKLSVCEDSDICFRIKDAGHRITYNKAITSYHFGYPRSLGVFFKKQLWHGKNLLKAVSKHKGSYLKIFIFSFFFLICIVWFLFGVASFDIRKILVSFSAVFMASFLLSVKAGFHKYNYSYVLPLTVLYAVMGISRGAALLNPRNWR